MREMERGCTEVNRAGADPCRQGRAGGKEPAPSPVHRPQVHSRCRHRRRRWQPGSRSGWGGWGWTQSAGREGGEGRDAGSRQRHSVLMQSLLPAEACAAWRGDPALGVVGGAGGVCWAARRGVKQLTAVVLTLILLPSAGDSQITRLPAKLMAWLLGSTARAGEGEAGRRGGGEHTVAESWDAWARGSLAYRLAAGRSECPGTRAMLASHAPHAGRTGGARRARGMPLVMRYRLPGNRSIHRQLPGRSPAPWTL